MRRVWFLEVVCFSFGIFDSDFRSFRFFIGKTGKLRILLMGKNDVDG